MQGIDSSRSNGVGEEATGNRMRGLYQRRSLEIQGAFDAGATGVGTIASRSDLLDEMVRELWAAAVQNDPRLASGIAVLAVGGYGRRELFPYSDVDLLFLLDGKVAEKELKDAIRRVGQELWDCAIRVSPATRKLAECEKFDEENTEFTVSLLDHRLVSGDAALYAKLAEQTVPKLLQREHKAILSRLTQLTRDRHAKYGGTLFHLEPNIKECPGGLRDVHLCGWIAMIEAASKSANGTVRVGTEAGAGSVEGSDGEYFGQGVEFLYRGGCFLHYRHERDDNTLDWLAQDAAAGAAVGLPGKEGRADAAYWMRLYFRHARSIDRQLKLKLEEISDGKNGGGKASRIFG